MKTHETARSEILLDSLLLEAFKVADGTGRHDIAEHVLCALECLCQDRGCNGAQEAYRLVCREAKAGHLAPKRSRLRH